MDRKSIIVVALCIVLIVLWEFVIVPKVLALQTRAHGHEQRSTVTITRRDERRQRSAAASTNGPAPQLEVNTNLPEQLLVISNDNARYTFSSYGGGLKLVQLLHFPEVVPYDVGCP